MVFFRTVGGAKWPFQACFASGSGQTEQQFETGPDFDPGRFNPPGMAPIPGHSGLTERGLMPLRSHTPPPRLHVLRPHALPCDFWLCSPPSYAAPRLRMSQHRSPPPRPHTTACGPRPRSLPSWPSHPGSSCHCGRAPPAGRGPSRRSTSR